MQLATFSVDGVKRLGLVVAERVVDIARHIEGAPGDMLGLIAQWPKLRPRLAALATQQGDYALREVTLHAPLPRVGKIFAIGLNYADHCAEASLAVPTEQTWFSKAPSSLNGPYEPIDLPAVSEQLDYECEMVAVIGKRCRNVPAARAAEVIFGYAVGDDVSVRDWQLRTSQWVLGKSFDTHAPIGPWITTADSVDPHTLDIRSLVNGEVRQSSNTKNLIFNVFAQVACLTQAVTLEPGDVLFTGTCGGVGAAFKPPKWLKLGDRVRIEIEKLGAIENVVQAGSARTWID